VKTLLTAAAAALIALSPVATTAARTAQQGIRQERVVFAKGASSATIKGQLKGDETVDYVVRASAGQTLTVSLKPSNRSNYFNVLPPDSQDVAMFADQSGADFTGMLPTDGAYKIRVYLVRAAARRNETSSYTLTVGVTGKALAPLPASQDAVIPGTSYHASTTVTCLAMPYGDAKPTQCDAFVIRRGHDGTATVEVRSSNTRRLMLFVAGKVVATDSMEKFTATKKGDVTTVRFDSGEFYEIIDALVFGG
jgi:hypothetical protein